MKNKIGQHIAEYRRKQNMTQQELADKLYVSNKTVSRWERGNGEPDVDQLMTIAELIGISVDELVGNKVAAMPSAPPAKKSASYRLWLRAGVIVLLVGALAALITLSAVNTAMINSRTEITKQFEAEWAVLNGVNTKYDLYGMVETAANASNGQCVANFGVKGNTLVFNIEASEADDNAVLYIAVVSRFNQTIQSHDVTYFDEVWNLYVNASEERLEKGEYLIVDRYYRSTDAGNPWYDFVEVSVPIGLQQGWNEIRFVVPRTGDGLYGLNMDYIRIETTADLKWNPDKENTVRLPDLAESG